MISRHLSVGRCNIAASGTVVGFIVIFISISLFVHILHGLLFHSIKMYTHQTTPHLITYYERLAHDDLASSLPPQNSGSYILVPR
jgi:hypothetical protein